MTIGVYGLGRFGSFWARLLAGRFEVRGCNRTPGRPVPDGVIAATEDETLSSDVVFLCVAISAMEEVLERIRGRLKPGALVLDTCSVKVHPVRLMKKLLPDSVSIIGTHPMFGPDSGKDGVAGLPLIMSPARNTAEQFELWRGIFLSFGLKVVTLSPEDHDREAAYTQGITHFIGRVLKDLELDGSEIATTGYRRLLEVMEQTCNDPWQLFIDLQRYNPYTRRMRQDLRLSLERMLERLEPSLDSSGAPRYDFAQDAASIQQNVSSRTGTEEGTTGETHV